MPDQPGIAAFAAAWIGWTGGGPLMSAWRAMTGADLPEIERIAALVHVDFPERAAVFAERLGLFPDGCLMTDGGYAIAHPTRVGVPPALDTLLGTLPEDADALHVHDVALLPRLRGQGRGAAAIAHLLRVATGHGFSWATLIAVHGTAPYWARFGFCEMSAAVATYGADARYMARQAVSPPAPTVPRP
jgi:GNAT superfamily N-acetyltransferase